MGGQVGGASASDFDVFDLITAASASILAAMADEDIALLVRCLEEQEARLGRLEEGNHDLRARCADLEHRLAYRTAHGVDPDLPLHRNRFVPWEVQEALRFERVPGIPVLWGRNPDQIPSEERAGLEERLYEAARSNALSKRPATDGMSFDDRAAEYRARMLDVSNALREVMLGVAGDHERLIGFTPIRCVRDVVFTELADLRARIDDLEEQVRSSSTTEAASPAGIRPRSSKARARTRSK